MTIGERIKVARERAGITQVELGEKIGVSGVAVMRYEKHTRQPRLEQIYAIADALNIPVEEILGIAPENRIVSSTDKLLYFFGMPNEDGQQKAVDRVEELTEIPRYQAGSPTQAAGDTPPPSPEGKDTTPPPPPPESP